MSFFGNWDQGDLTIWQILLIIRVLLRILLRINRPIQFKGAFDVLKEGCHFRRLKWTFCCC